MKRLLTILLFMLILPTFFTYALKIEQYNVANEKLQCDQVNDVFFYDTSEDNISDSWRTDNTKSWYNEPSNPSDDFTGFLDDNRWQSLGNIEVDSGFIHFSDSCTYYIDGTNTNGAIFSENKWKLTGDFDIRICYDEYVAENGGGIRFEIKDDGYPQNYYLFVERKTKSDGSDVYDRDDYDNNYSEVSTSDTSGRLRIVRTGDNVTTYYGYWDAGSGDDQDRWKWTAIGSATYFGSYDVYVKVFTVGSGSEVEVETDIDNFIAIYETGGCNFPNVGSHTRSTTNAFPKQAILVATEKGLDIIDTSDNSLWMRFVCYDGSSEDPAQYQNMVADRLHKVFALDGKIYSGAYNGFMLGVSVIDFTSSSSWFYDAHTIGDGTGWNYLGNISYRNMHSGWTDNDADYISLLGWKVYDLCAKKINDDTYLALANGVDNEIGYSLVSVLNLDDNVISYDKISGNSNNMIGVDFGENDYLYYLEKGHIYVEYSDFLNSGEFNADASGPVAIPTGLEACDLVTTNDYLYIAEKTTSAPFTAGKTRKHNLNDVSYENVKYEHWSGAQLYLWGSSNCTALETNNNALWVATNNSTEGRIYIIGAKDPRQDSLRGDINIPSPLVSGNISSLSFGASTIFPENLVVGYDSMGVTRLYGEESSLSLESLSEGEIQHNFSNEDFVEGDPFTYHYDSLQVTIDPADVGTYGNVNVFLNKGTPECPYPEHTLAKWYQIKLELGFDAFPVEIDVQFTSPIPAGSDNLQLWYYSMIEEEWIPDSLDNEVTVNNWNFSSSPYFVNYNTNHLSAWAMNNGSGGALAYPPKKPENLMISTNDSSVILIWNKVTENTFGDTLTDVDYNIYTSEFPYFLPNSTYYLDTVSDTTYTHEDVLQNDKLYYKITADD